MLNYLVYLDAFKTACEQQAEIYGNLVPANDYERGFYDQVSVDLFCFSEEVESYMQEIKRPRIVKSCAPSFHQRSAPRPRPPLQHAQDILSLLVCEAELNMPEASEYAYSEDIHKRGLSAVFARLHAEGFAEFAEVPNVDDLNTIKDYDAYNKGAFEGAEFVIQSLLPQLIKDFPDMTEIGRNAYWQLAMTEMPVPKYPS